MARKTKSKLTRLGLALLASCCSLLIASCAGQEPAKGVDPVKGEGRPPPGCNNQATCFVDVLVLSCKSISAFPDPIPVPPHLSEIVWTIGSVDGPYHFPQGGITIKKPPSGSGIAPPPGPIGNPALKFGMHDDHSVRGTITYSITLIKDSTGEPCTVDPLINNQ